MSSTDALNAAREDTKSILANLQKGQILLETTSKDYKPMNFAWIGPKSGVAALKRISETKSVFPVYNLDKIERSAKSPSKSLVAPITYDPEQNAKCWESENHANYHNIQNSNNAVEGNVGGLKSGDHVNMPTQFAWNRMNVDGASDAKEAYDCKYHERHMNFGSLYY
jgi:hypothetical protein